MSEWSPNWARHRLAAEANELRLARLERERRAGEQASDPSPSGLGSPDDPTRDGPKSGT